MNSLRRVIDCVIGKYFPVSIIIMILLVGIIYLSILIKNDNAELNTVVSVTPLLALLVVIIQLARKLMLDRAGFIENYISKFFLDQTLYKTFHDLIYTYKDDTFKQLECIRIDQKLDKEKKPVFEQFSEFQGKREIGSRLYHPRLFQGSYEEMRLDAVLGYFNVIAYRYSKGLLHIDDISGSIGYCLLVMRSRRVIEEYLNFQEASWGSPKYQKFGHAPPLEHLKKLMDAVYEHKKSSD